MQVAVRKHPLIGACHVATGDFQKALELYKKQIALCNYEPLKQVFVDFFTLSRLRL